MTAKKKLVICYYESITMRIDIDRNCLITTLKVIFLVNLDS